MDDGNSWLPPTTFIVSRGRSTPRSSSKSAINAHIATIAHRRRRDADARQRTSQPRDYVSSTASYIEYARHALAATRLPDEDGLGRGRGRPRSAMPQHRTRLHRLISAPHAPRERQLSSHSHRETHRDPSSSSSSAAASTASSNLHSSDSSLTLYDAFVAGQSCLCAECWPRASSTSSGSLENSDSSRSPSPPLWVGSFDPFSNLPIQLDSHGHSLLHHCE